MMHQKIQKQLAPILKPLSHAYAGIMRLREWMYKLGLKKSSRPKAFCISVGNIAWGGSGKTPLTGWLLEWSFKKGLLPAMLTRGYGGKSNDRPLPVKPWMTPEQCGDEPLMLAQTHPDALILADPRRSRALSWAQVNSTANVFILDDGMQHLKVQRDLNLVLLRVKDLQEEWNRVIPAGSWREKAQALGRADAFLLRASPAEFKILVPALERHLSTFNRPAFSFDLVPTAISPLNADTPPLDTVSKSPYAVCTAVGSPESVLKSVAEFLGYPPDKEYIFPDHHRFSKKNAALLHKAKMPVIITEKDAVKLTRLQNQTDKTCLYVLHSRINFGPSRFTKLSFIQWLDEKYADMTQLAGYSNFN